MKKILVLFLALNSLFFIQVAYARKCKMPEEWKNLCHILENRIEQSAFKMKLSESDVNMLEQFLTSKKNSTFRNLNELQNFLPKTTIELLMGLRFRNVPVNNAESIALYLKNLVNSCKFQNLAAFDNNTSHIIGREWDEIDYSREGMTWQNQKTKYAPFGITNFKTLENVRKFFPVEFKLPYFKKIYNPIAECKF